MTKAFGPRLLLLLLLVGAIGGPGFGQKRFDNFYFSWYMGMRIDGCGETVLNDGQMNGVTAGGAGTISDTAGNLLFYSNSMSVWNSSHQVMPNGNFTTFWNGITSHYQGPVFVPYPGKDNLYYLFHESRTQVWNNDGDFVVELHYSLIDRNLDAGRGDISVKDQFLYANTTEATAAVTDATGNGYWMVSHMTTNDSFVVYHVGPAGLDTQPTYYKIGTVFGNTWRDRQVVIKFTPDRTKMVITRNIPSVRPNDDRDGGFDLYQFNDTTGAITNPIIMRDGFVTEVPNSLGQYFSTGAEFSPNSKLLYVSTWDKLFQLDISTYDSTAIDNSRTLVGTSDFDSYGLGQVLLGSNGKIYLTKFYPDQYLGEIKNTDVPGTGCGFVTDAVYFPNAIYGVSLTEGLGNCIQPYLHSAPFSPADLNVSQTCLGDSTIFLLPMSGVDSVKWDFGDASSGTSDTSSLTQPKHYFPSPLDYSVRSIVYSTCAQDTVEKVVTISHPSIDLGNDTTLCAGQTFYLNAGLPGATYLWQDGSLLDSILVSKGGQYQVTANYRGCAVSDSVVVMYQSLPGLSIGKDTALCAGDSLLLSDPAAGLKYKWQDGSAVDSFVVRKAGEYSLTVTDTYGCTSSDTVAVSFIPQPVFSLGTDTTLCSGQQLSYDFNSSGVTYNWNDGTNGGVNTIRQAGLYWLNAEQNGCSYRDSIVVNYKPLPVADLGPDTLICVGDTKLLTVAPLYTSILWNDGSHSNQLLVDAPGIYWATIDLQGCSVTDSISIAYHGVPEFSLGSDTMICNGTIILLNPDVKGADLLWQDNSTAATYTVTEPGTYSLTATNICGASSKDVHVIAGVCTLSIPNAFTPNGDGHNDLFRVKYPGFIERFRMRIFDRWGQLVFETSDAREGWNGYFRGQPQPAGTYVWTIYYHDVLGNDVSQKGTVMLIR